MNVISSAVPRAYLQGTQDLSTTVPPVAPNQLPTHLPLIPLFTQRGTTEPQLVDGTSMLSTYGANTFDPRQPFFNHQTKLCQTITSQGQAVMIQRMLPANATQAVLRLSLEVASATGIPKYQRDPNSGQYLLNANGALIPVLDANSQPVVMNGISYVWHLNHLNPTAAQVGQGTPSTNTLPRTGGAASTIYPIADLLVSSYGAYGNNIGLRLSAPNALSNAAPNVSLMRQVQQYMYRFQLVELLTNQVIPTITMTQKGATFLDLCLTPNVVDPTYGTTISAVDGLVPQYQNLLPAAGPAVQSPFSQLYLYETNIQTVVSMLFASEAAALTGDTLANTAWLPVDYTQASNAGLMNILSGMDFNGVPYESIRMVSVSDTDMVTFDNNLINTQYAQGGADGDVSVGNFDTLVQGAFTSFGNFTGADGKFWPLLDDARYPVSVVYDSGYSLPTKKALLNAMGARPDVCVILGTHYVGSWQELMVGSGSGATLTNTWVPNNVQLTESQEQSMAIALRAAAQTFPESDTFGTPTVRCYIQGHSGTLINDNYTGLLPLTLDIASKCAAYMGAGTGIWNSSNAFDIDPNNKVTLFTGVNNTWKSDTTYDQDWADALNWVQQSDMRTLFYPAFHTVYPNDTSILTSIFAMFVVCDLEKIAKNSWRSLTGSNKYTTAQLIQKSNQYITQAVNQRYDGRYVIIPNTMVTALDEQRGYSWSATINMYGNNMKTVASFTITANRMSALPATNS